MQICRINISHIYGQKNWNFLMINLNIHACKTTSSQPHLIKETHATCIRGMKQRNPHSSAPIKLFGDTFTNHGFALAALQKSMLEVDPLHPMRVDNLHASRPVGHDISLRVAVNRKAGCQPGLSFGKKRTKVKL